MPPSIPKAQAIPLLRKIALSPDARYSGALTGNEEGRRTVSQRTERSVDHLDHGGNTRLIAQATGIPEKEILDYSANINPFGPPPWLEDAIAEGTARITFYPDPEATEAREAAAARYSSTPRHFLFADGADSLLFALPRALGANVCILPSPTYSGYRRAARRSGSSAITLPLLPEENFRLDGPRFLSSLRTALEDCERKVSATGSSAADRTQEDQKIVFLGAPNNPTGGTLPKATVEELAQAFPSHFFVIDESFFELSRGGDSLIGTKTENIIVARSLTKAWAVPGARIGFIYAKPEIITTVRAEIPAWPVSSFALAIARRALADTSFLAHSVPLLLEEEESFSAALGSLPGFKVFRSGANFLLVDFGEDRRGEAIARVLLERGIAVRRFSPGEGLSGRYARLAVRSRGENLRILEALRFILASERLP
jgi:histidinol-phosphate/aromatic aminotransferase/cobyric acid decarboxylase-like protein